MDVLSQFEKLLPLAVTWASEQERRILRDGMPLSDDEKFLARRIGVIDIECVRLLRVPRIPMPHDATLGQAALQSGFISSRAQGMAVRCGIFIRESAWRNREIIAHELVHTAQYEQMGFENFLRVYLKQCLSLGYANSPLELQAVEVAARVLNEIEA